MTELLFECYNVPSVCKFLLVCCKFRAIRFVVCTGYGIDDLFSLFYNQQSGPQKQHVPQPVLSQSSSQSSQSSNWDSLIVSSGLWATYVCPFINGRPALSA